MKSQLTAIAAALAALIESAADLKLAGAVRQEHEQRFSLHQTALDQVGNQVADALASADNEQPDNPDAAAFAALSERIKTMAMTVDHTADAVDLLAKHLAGNV
jgi:hypothetical protein